MSSKQNCLFLDSTWSHKFNVDQHKLVDGNKNKKLRALINIKEWQYGSNVNKFLAAVKNPSFCRYQAKLLRKYFKYPEKYLSLDCDNLTITFKCTEKDIDKLLGRGDEIGKGFKALAKKRYPSVFQFDNRGNTGNINAGSHSDKRPYYTKTFRILFNGDKRKFFELNIADGSDEKYRNTPLGVRIVFIPNRFSDHEINLFFSLLRSVLHASRYRNFVNKAKITRVDLAVNLPGLFAPFLLVDTSGNEKTTSALPDSKKSLAETVYIGKKGKSSHLIIYDKLLKEFKKDIEHSVSVSDIEARLAKVSVTTRLEHRFYPYKNGASNNKALLLKDLLNVDCALDNMRVLSPIHLPHIDEKQHKAMLCQKSFIYLRQHLKAIRQRSKKITGKGVLTWYRIKPSFIRGDSEELLAHYQTLIIHAKKPKADAHQKYLDSVAKPIKPVSQMDEHDFVKAKKRAIKAQVLAAEAKEKHIMVVAGAGSGKTRTITQRVTYLLEQKQIHPKKIKVLAYTNEASKELNQRINIARVRNVFSAGFDDNVAVSTFSAWCKGMLDTYWPDRYRQYSLIMPDRAKATLLQLAKKVGIDSNSDRLEAIDILSFSINRCCRLRELAEQDYLETLRALRTEYRHWKQQNDYYDFDDFIYRLYRELKKDKAMALKVSQNVQHLIVDEMQDSNPLQWRVLTLLIKQGTSLYCVGDPAQSIFGFRGASFKEIEMFDETFSDGKTYYLSGSFRLTNQLLALSNYVRSVINPRYHQLVCCTDNGVLPKVVEHHDMDKMCVWLRRKLIERFRDNNPRDKVLVLARTNKAVEAIKEALSENDSVKVQLDKRLKVMTMHKAKGLESEACFVVDPRLSKSLPETKGDTLRLLYVALTRAKRELVICKSLSGNSYYSDAPNDINLIDLISKQEHLYEVDN